MSSENRSRWKKRKRGGGAEAGISTRRKPEYDPEDDPEEDPDDENGNHIGTNNNNNEDNDYDLHNPNNPNPSRSSDPVTEVLLSEEGDRVCVFPLVVKRAVNRPHVSVMNVVAMERAVESGESSSGRGGGTNNHLTLENVSYGQMQVVSGLPVDYEEKDRGFVFNKPVISDGLGVVKRFGSGHSHVVPMHSDWFSPITIHRLERQNVPHFFSGKSPSHTPEKYRECRNWIVAKYMENPEKKLLVSDCQALLEDVDQDDLNRILRFLDNWGLINYCAGVSSNVDPLTVGSSLTEDPNGELHVPSVALKSIDSLIKFDKPRCKLKAIDVYSSPSHNDVKTCDLDSKIRERLSENRCGHCLQPIPAMYYQSQKEADVLLCPSCFHDGRFISGHSSIDFIRTDSGRDFGDLDGESWTDQETLLLLEGVEIYQENWNDIADHVGTKSKAQCILHFIRMPVENGLLENFEVPSMPSSTSCNGGASARLYSNSNGDSAGTCHQSADLDNRLPFVHSKNPVMALVSFLASVIGPRVAAACAHASLVVLTEDNDSTAPGHPSLNRGSSHVIRSNSENIHGDLTNSSQNREEKLVSQASRSQEESEALSAEKLQLATRAGLAAASVKAKIFGDHEEREIQRLSANIINHQLKRLELKLKQFAEVETLLMKECEQVERTRQRFAAERSRLLSIQSGSAGSSAPLSPQGVGPSSVNSFGTNRQQVASSSQPSPSGFGNNQAVHPNMSYVPRPQMFGFGPRLPLSAIQPSSSSQNAMFNNQQANPQGSLGHPLMRSVSGTSSGLG